MSDYEDYYNDFDDYGYNEDDDNDEYGNEIYEWEEKNIMNDDLDENKFQNEYNFTDRTSTDDNLILSEVGIQRLEGKGNLLSKRDKLVINIFNTYNNIARLHQQVFGESQDFRNQYIKEILSPYIDIPQISDDHRLLYVNPSALILGFVASQKGTQITKDSFENAVKIFDDLEDKNQVNKVSLLRYSRFWIDHVKKNKFI